MREVTKEEFYKIITEQNLDVHPKPKEHLGFGEFIVHWKYKNGSLFGQIIPKKELDTYPFYIRHYYIY